MTTVLVVFIIFILFKFSNDIVSLYDSDKAVITISSYGLMAYSAAVFPPYFTEMML